MSSQDASLRSGTAFSEDETQDPTNIAQQGQPGIQRRSKDLEVFLGVSKPYVGSGLVHPQPTPHLQFPRIQCASKDIAKYLGCPSPMVEKIIYFPTSGASKEKEDSWNDFIKNKMQSHKDWPEGCFWHREARCWGRITVSPALMQIAEKDFRFGLEIERRLDEFLTANEFVQYPSESSEYRPKNLEVVPSRARSIRN